MQLWPMFCIRINNIKLELNCSLYQYCSQKKRAHAGVRLIAEREIYFPRHGIYCSAMYIDSVNSILRSSYGKHRSGSCYTVVKISWNMLCIGYPQRHGAAAILIWGSSVFPKSISLMFGWIKCNEYSSSGTLQYNYFIQILLWLLIICL